MERLDENFGKSEDMIASNIEQLRQLFPGAFTEGKIDFEVLKQLLGEYIETNVEKYGLNWFGKKKARQFALTPSLGTLRPYPDESVDWNKTKNVMVEGENLEVLKILQKSLSGRVKVIYIDPPYNTGGDFVYPDNYKDSIKNYLDLTGQTSSGTKVSSNLESSGRYHTDWLNMMYPRLIVARAMLHSEGLIFISIDESEYHNLRTICDDVLGEENYLNTVSIKVRENAGESGGGEDKKLKKNIEYIVIYSKDRNSYTLPKLSSETSLRLLLAQNELAGDNYVYSSVITKLGEKKFLKTIEDGAGLPIDVYTYDSFESESIKSLSRKTDKPLIDIYLQYYDKIYTTYNARTSIRDRVKEAVGDFSGLVEISYKPRSGKYKDVLTSKFFSGNTMRLWANLNEISEIKGNDIVIKSPLGTMWNDISFAALANEGDVKFDNGKKPVSMIKRLLQFCEDDNAIVMDFFAGSGSTGHAVMRLNEEDGGQRRYVLVQLPEPLDISNNSQKDAALFCDSIGKPRNIAEITKERLRRAGSKLRGDATEVLFDKGFRVFKLDSSNVKAWDPSAQNIEGSIEEYTEYIRHDRSENDILFELLLKQGLDLSVQVESKDVCDKIVYNIGYGVLLVCLSTSINSNEIESLAQGMIDWIKTQNPETETVIVFRDSAFENDVAKTNITAIFNQHGFSNIRSL